MYTDLHSKIASRSVNGRLTQLLTTISTALANSFLNVVDCAKGGSVGRGTAIPECQDAELVLFLKGLPMTKQQWRGPFLRMAHGALASLLLQYGEDLQCTDDSLRLALRDGATLEIRFAPAFRSLQQAIQALGASGPQARKDFEPCFVTERTRFVAGQPGVVKTVMRLLKWWRNMQSWSCELTRPSDYLLELLVIYAAQQSCDQAVATLVADSLGLCARFDQLRVVWANYYKPQDVWAPLLLQRPLLMDPVNPFSNIADPQDFDSRELVRVAGSTNFFW